MSSSATSAGRSWTSSTRAISGTSFLRTGSGIRPSTRRVTVCTARPFSTRSRSTRMWPRRCARSDHLTRMGLSNGSTKRPSTRSAAPAFRKTFNKAIDSPKKDRDRWLEFYRARRARLGNRGRRPVEIVLHYPVESETGS